MNFGDFFGRGVPLEPQGVPFGRRGSQGLLFGWLLDGFGPHFGCLWGSLCATFCGSFRGAFLERLWSSVFIDFGSILDNFLEQFWWLLGVPAEKCERSSRVGAGFILRVQRGSGWALLEVLF